MGGTSEARELARRIAGDGRISAVLSLAGRTAAPRTQAVPCRIGGFGGVDGLVRWLQRERVDAIIDATHPFAAQISKNAVEAARLCALPVGSLVRAPWQRQSGDRWSNVGDVAASVDAIGSARKTIFLTVGRLELSCFEKVPQHRYVARTIDPPGDIPLPPDISFVFARGPFDVESERQLMLEKSIDVVVTKNSGGAMTYPKIEAARALGLRVIMVDRPEKPQGATLRDVDAAVTWINTLMDHHATSRSERGV